MRFLSGYIAIIALICFTATASARTWRDPKYGGVYVFGDDGNVTANLSMRKFSGKWWKTTQSSIRFQIFDANGRPLGINSLDMKTKDTAVVRLAGVANSFRWKLVESRGGPATKRDPAESGWFMEALRF